MDKIIAIIKREYLTRVRSKSFVIGTILSPLIMMSFIIVPILVVGRGGTSDYKLVLLEQTGDAALMTRLDQLLMENNAKSDRYTVLHVAVPAGESIESRRPPLDKQVGSGEISAYMVLPQGVLNQDKLTLRAKNVSDFANRGRIEHAVNAAISEQRLIRAGLNPEQIRTLNREVDLEVENPEGQSERGQTFILAYALLLILYITILIYGVTVMRGVIEEKQSRIVEVLLSSVRPFQLMLGKLVGIGLVGLTQYFTWAIFIIVISTVAALPAFAMGAFKMPNIPASLIVYFVVYFVLGYFLYATLYAAVGALVTSEEDAQQVQLPVTMFIVIPMIFSSAILRNPNSTFSIVLSLFPFFAPVLMFMRICLSQPPFWQIGLSMLLMIFTILGAVWVSAKIYRVGILMYGKRPNLPEIMKWLRYT
jgi:ABC-2 type transport system permease protein